MWLLFLKADLLRQFFYTSAPPQLEPAPAQADGVAAHEAVDGCWIKRGDEQLHVFLEIVVVSQISGKAPDRKIRDRVEIVEHDAEICRELALEIRLQVGLRTR